MSLVTCTLRLRHSLVGQFPSDVPTHHLSVAHQETVAAVRYDDAVVVVPHHEAVVTGTCSVFLDLHRLDVLLKVVPLGLLLPRRPPDALVTVLRSVADHPFHEEHRPASLKRGVRRFLARRA